MLPDGPTLVLLLVTLALQAGHVLVHVLTTFVWRRDELPWYDPHVGYAGALAWFLMVVVDMGTLDAHLALALSLGLVLTGVGLYVHGIGIRDIMVHGGDGVLVTQGIYRRLRHPIYYGWVLVSFGMPLLLNSYWGLVTAPLWSGLIVAVGLMEGRDMRRRFGAEYEGWARTTWL